MKQRTWVILAGSQTPKSALVAMVFCGLAVIGQSARGSGLDHEPVGGILLGMRTSRRRSL